MTLHLGKGRSLAAALASSVVLALSVLVLPAVTAPAGAATPLTLSDLEMSSTVGTSSSRIGDLETLLAWSAADPVDAFEMRRNDRIHAQWQGNRNPFVDHPEWAAAIWS